ncbi:MAG: hypothetical protein AAF471_07945 [Myxococcota bacterium]
MTPAGIRTHESEGENDKGAGNNTAVRRDAINRVSTAVGRSKAASSRRTPKRCAHPADSSRLNPRREWYAN